MNDRHNRLRLVRAGIDTYQQPVVYMHRDCSGGAQVLDEGR